MEIKAADVKKLREKTGAGMLDCKKALEDAQGDFAKAEKLLKELGLAAAAKRSGRATNEGRVFSFLNGSKGTLLELSCETDFVARNSEFINLGKTLVKTVSDKNITEMNDELTNTMNDAISRIKENMILRRFKSIKADANEILVDYIHGEGKIGVIIKIKAEKAEALQNQIVKDLAFDLALHIAAFNPLFLSREKISPAYLKEQEEIFTKQAQSLGKPENVLAGIVKGKINKHFSEICLVDQGFVKDEKKPVAKVLEEKGKEIGSKLTISDYLYFRVGEEI